MAVPALVTTDWLAAHLGDPHVRIVDARWSLLEPGKGRAAHEAAHVPGAAYLDVDADLSAPRGQGPGRHPLPTAERFGAAMSRAGVDATTHVVAYDFGDGSTAARAWWLLRHFGHERVSLLDGGWARWIAEHRATESGAPAIAPATFVPRVRNGDVVAGEEVERLRHDPGTLVVDSRMPERYEGLKEPIDPVAGHVPLAVNHPYPRNVRAADDPRFLPPEALREQFTALGAARAERVIAYCGSGVNACQNLFAMHVAGFPDALLYEGSWSDWCSTGRRPVGTGAGAARSLREAGIRFVPDRLVTLPDPGRDSAVLVVGGSGRTGQRVLQLLLQRGVRVRAIVRSVGKLAPGLAAHPRLALTEAGLLSLPDERLQDLVRGCDAVVSCLGHVLSLRGVFGPPRDLVTRATVRLCRAIEVLQPAAPIKFILMTSVSVNRAGGLDTRRGAFERAFLQALCFVVPPAGDNQRAADLLQCEIGANHPFVEWTVVRPDTLLPGEVSQYAVHEGLVDGLFAPGHTSMANVAHFMCELVTNATTWADWKGRLPVIVNAGASAARTGAGRLHPVRR